MREKVTARKSHAPKGDRAEKSCAEVSARKCQRENIVRGSVGQSMGHQRLKISVDSVMY